MNENNMERFNLFISKQQRDRLIKESLKTGLSISELIRRAIDEKYEEKTNDKG